MVQTHGYEETMSEFELWLVEISVSEGEGSFFCERCLDQENRRFIETSKACHNDGDIARSLTSLGLFNNK